MPSLTLQLIDKRLKIRADDDGFKKTLSFGIRMPKRERLITLTGEDVKQGYIEFTEESPRFPKPHLHFIPAWKDKETHEMNPASISFYADLTASLFKLVAEQDSTAMLVLHINTQDFVGAIKYGHGPDGYEKVWDTEKENPVQSISFEIDISYSTKNDT